MNKVVVVGTVGIPACYGGFESLVENLTANAGADTRYTVFCSGNDYINKLSKFDNADLIYLPFKANGIQSVIYDIFSLIKCWRLKPNTVLILGVSGCVFLPLFRIFSNAKIITNIDGLEWKREKWNKLAKVFLKYSEEMAVKHSDIIVTDNKAIEDYVRDEYNISSVTIAYGGDHAIRNLSSVKSANFSYCLGLCRIEPENNVTMILEAFSKTNTRIIFIGNWNSSEFGKSLRDVYRKFNNIELLDPIYDLDKLATIRNGCSLYIHGHSAGGTNPSLVEMMHFGVPILAYDCNFNRYSTEDKAHYFSDSDQLRHLLEALTDTELKNNASCMYEIANRRYTWKEINQQYESIY